MYRRLCAAAVLTLAPIPPAEVQAQVEDPELAAIYQVLEYAKLDALLGSLVESFPAQVESLLPSPLSRDDSERLTEAVRAQFALDSIRLYVAEGMWEQSDPEVVEELLTWLPSGAVAEIDAIVGDEPSEIPLEAYAQSLQANPPPESRIQAAAQWASVQGAGDFYALLADAQMYAAHQIAGALSEDAPEYEEPSEAQLVQYAQGGFNAAVVSFLQQLEPVPDSLIAAATEEYSSESGQWFVEAYTYAVYEALRLVGENAAHQLEQR